MKAIRFAVTAAIAAMLLLGVSAAYAEEGGNVPQPAGSSVKKQQQQPQQQQQVRPAVTAHPRFMKEFAVWTYNLISKEDEVRAAVDEYLKEKASDSETGKLGMDDVGSASTDLISFIEDKLNVRMGAYKVRLGGWARLDQDETRVYRSALRLISVYLSAIEVQEARKLGLLEKGVGDNAPLPINFRRRLVVGLAPYTAIELTDEQKRTPPSFIRAIVALDNAAKNALQSPDATSGEPAE